MGYRGDALKGFGWIGSLRIISRAISFVKTAILAHILSPYQFGVFGVAALVLSFAETITETGINVFLVQNREKINNYVSTAWIISITRGILIALIIILTS